MPTDELSGLFDAERSVQPPTETVERGLARLLGDVAAQVAPLPIASGALKLAWSAVSKWLIVGFVVGLAGAGAASQIWAPAALASSPAIAQSAAPIASPNAAEVAPPVAVASAPPSETPEAPPRQGGPVSAPTTPTSNEGQATFDAELRLITAAKTELDRGRAPQAKAWLTEHAQRFPGGVFATEREALQILVQCSQIREPDAAREFARRHPGSPMTERLLRACTPPVPASVPSAVEFPK